jgi:hypothetical protein
MRLIDVAAPKWLAHVMDQAALLRLRSRFPPSLRKTAVIKDSGPLVSLRNGDLPVFLSLTGHLLQKPPGEAMGAETLLLCAGHR